MKDLLTDQRLIYLMQKQATQLIMKKCGILEPRKMADEADHHRFRCQFVEPLLNNAVDDFCEAFGLNDPEDGASQHGGVGGR